MLQPIIQEKQAEKVASPHFCKKAELNRADDGMKDPVMHKLSQIGNSSAQEIKSSLNRDQKHEYDADENNSQRGIKLFRGLYFALGSLSAFCLLE